MPKTKSKPEKKNATKGNPSKPSKKKAEREAPRLKDPGEAFEEGIAAAPSPPKSTKKGTKKKAATHPSTAPASGASTTIGSESPPTPTEAPPSAPESLPDLTAAPLPTTTAAASETKAKAGESRMPPVGTVIRKLDRQGAVRCECTVVEEGGVQYAGKVYKSPSAAAVAAAKDLGLSARAMNGWTFWGLSKTTRAVSGSDPTVGLERAWERYHEHLGKLLEKVRAGEHREPVLATMQRHARVLQHLHDEVRHEELPTCSACGGNGVETIGDQIHSPCRSCRGEGVLRTAS